MAITYRTTDLAQWGTGQGSNLSAAQVDANFWTLYEMIQAVAPEAGVGIASATVSGDQLTFTMTDATTLGPFTLPTIELNPRGNWTASTSYSVNDTIAANGNVYLVTWTHTSAATFSAGANDGSGHDYYALLFNIPGNTLPSGGTTGQLLAKNSATNYDVHWIAPPVVPSVNSGLATTGTVSISPAQDQIIKITPTGNITLNAAAVATGPLTFVFTTSGTTSYNVTFGTNFKSTGTLATETTTGKVFTVSFIGDGSTYFEIARTVAM